MPYLDKLGSAHECFAALLHAIDPVALIRIACAAAGVSVGELDDIRYQNPRVEVPNLVKRAQGLIVDLVYTVHAADHRVVEAWVFEPQLSKDRRKLRLWALYEIAMDAEFHTDSRVAVFAPEPTVRSWFRTRVLPRMKTRPILIERDQIERITDYEDARRRPELAILGCLYHAHEPALIQDCVAVFRAAWIAIQSLALRPAARYAVAVMSIVPPNVVERGAEELRERGELDEERWELFTDSELGGHSYHRGRQAGREEGREEGRVELLRRAILDVLELRGFALAPEHRERVASCESVQTLERWYEAVKAAAANQPVDQMLA